MLGIREEGENHDFPPKLFCLTVPKNFVKEPFSVSLTAGIEKFQGYILKIFWHERDSNPEPAAWEPCYPNPTAVIYFWKTGNFGLKKKRPYWMNNFSCKLHMRRKIITIAFFWPMMKLLSLAQNNKKNLIQKPFPDRELSQLISW